MAPQLHWLLNSADRLSTQSGIPLDFLRLLELLRIRLRRSADSGPSHVIKLDARNYEIVLTRHYRSHSQALTSGQRFTVAHELGHILLDYKYKLRPSSPKVFHDVEHWCNAFASRLLIPEDSLINVKLSAWKELPGLLLSLTRTFLAPEAVVARRLGQRYPALFLARAVAHNNAKGNYVLRVQWATDNSSLFGIVRGSHITDTHLLAPLLPISDGGPETQVSVGRGEVTVRRLRLNSKAYLIAARCPASGSTSFSFLRSADLESHSRGNRAAARPYGDISPTNRSGTSYRTWPEPLSDRQIGRQAAMHDEVL
jgi:hypothetical protein